MAEARQSRGQGGESAVLALSKSTEKQSELDVDAGFIANLIRQILETPPIS